jgi:uncharacterized protein (TIGR04255 family)
VYPNAPIVLVAIEIRHPADGPLGRSHRMQLSTSVRDVLPVPDEATTVTVELLAASDRQPAQRQMVTSVPRWTARDRRTALTVRPDGLVIETSRYRGYEQIRDLLELALRARAAVSAPAGVERIGLRYIDEIRVPSDRTDGRPSWQEWVDPSLLGPVHVADGIGLTPAGGEGISVFSGTGDKALVLRYGVQDGYAVQSTPQLRRPLPPPGPLFKLDIDSFWQSANEVPEFTVDFVLECADELHAPVSDLFESLISDRLREEVLRNG